MTIDIRQSSFTGGETAPILNARTDLSKYLTALRRSRNGYPIRHGAWMNRAGTRFVCEVKDSAKKVRLVRFNFAAGQNFVLEFGDQYVRWVKDGGQLQATGAVAWSSQTSYWKDAHVTYGGSTYRSLQAANAGKTPATEPTWWEVCTVYEISTPYAVADLPRLKFAQVGDIITVTHSSYAPRELRRYGNLDWRLQEITFTSPSHGIAAHNASLQGGVTVTDHSAALGAGNYYATARDGLKVVAVGSAHVCATSEDGGKTWTSRTAAMPVGDYSGVARDGLNVVAVGLNVCAISTDGGATWSDKSAQLGAGDFRAVAVSGAAVVAVGFNHVCAISSDRGATWTSRTAQMPVGHYTAVARNVSDVVAVGLLGARATSTDGGMWWSAHGVGANNLYGVVRDGASVVAVGSNSGVATCETSEDGGATWTDRSGQLPGGSYNALCREGSTLTAVGGSVYIGRSLDGGKTWKEYALAGAGSLFGAAAYAGSVLAVGQNKCSEVTTGPANLYGVWLNDKAYIEYDIDKALTLQRKEYRYRLTLLLREIGTRRVVETLVFAYGDDAPGGTAYNGVQIRDTTVAKTWTIGIAYTAGEIVIYSGGVYRALVNVTAAGGEEPSVLAMLGVKWWPVVPGTVVGVDQSVGGAFSLTEHKPKIAWPGVIAPAGYDLIGFRLYRGQEGVYGLLADVGSDIRYFVDDGSAEVDFTLSPPSSENPFLTDWPAITTFFEQRRLMANTPARPADVLGSKTGDYYNFGWKPLIVDDDAITGLTLASQSFEEIRWMLPLRALLLGTNEGVWMMSGAGGVNDALTALSVKARKQVARPSAWLDPIAIDNAALTLQEFGNFVREVLYDYATDSYQNVDLSVMAEHLFEGFEIVSWAYAQAPHGILWAARDDGKLLGFTYSREHELAAWHWHDTDGAFEQVCTVAEGKEHAVYTVANRTINGSTKRYIERFASRVLPRLGSGEVDVTKGVFLDSSLTYDGAPATVFSGLDHLAGKSVTVLADGAVCGPYVVTQVAGQWQIDISAAKPGGASYVTVGLAYTSQLETLDVISNQAELKHRWKRVVRIFFEVIDSLRAKFGSDYTHLKEWSKAATTAGHKSIAVPSTFTKDGRVVVQQDAPLPLTLLSVTREMEMGDD